MKIDYFKACAIGDREFDGTVGAVAVYYSYNITFVERNFSAITFNIE